MLTPTQLEEIAALLEADQVVALPTETVYGLAGRAASRAAVERIFAVKERPGDNPLIVHVAAPEAALALGRSVPPWARHLADAFWPGPLSLVLESAVEWPWVQGGHPTVAVRVPRPDWLRELLARTGPLAAPSANRSGRPSPTTAGHCLADLAGRIPAVVDGGPCEGGLESTVVDCTGPEPVILRPGPVTAEMIAGALASAGPPRVEEEDGSPARGGAGAAPVTAAHSPVARAASPGTRHPHYRPRARVVLLEEGQPVPEGHAMVIAPGDLPPGSPPQTLVRRWESPEALARNLYAWFREADHAGVPVIYVYRPARTGLGVALLNRLEKAAGD